MKPDGLLRPHQPSAWRELRDDIWPAVWWFAVFAAVVCALALLALAIGQLLLYLVRFL